MCSVLAPALHSLGFKRSLRQGVALKGLRAVAGEGLTPVDGRRGGVIRAVGEMLSERHLGREPGQGVRLGAHSLQDCSSPVRAVWLWPQALASLGRHEAAEPFLGNLGQL